MGLERYDGSTLAEALKVCAPRHPRVVEVSVVFPQKSYWKMIENPELTRKILEYFASDEIRFPANKTLDDLKSEFSDEELDVLAYHVSCAHEEGLLDVGLTKTSTLPDGELITVGWITGLTQPGGEYVRHSQTKFWNQAKNVI